MEGLIEIGEGRDVVLGDVEGGDVGREISELRRGFGIVRACDGEKLRREGEIEGAD